MQYLDLEENVNIGGHRATVNDLKQLQVAHDQLQQILVDTIGTVGTNGRVLAGFEQIIDNGNISCTGGWLFAKGQIWEIEPLAPTPVLSGGVPFLVFKFSNTYPPVQYQSAGFFQVHRRRYCEVQYLGGSQNPQGTQGEDYVRVQDEYRPEWVELSTANIATLSGQTIDSSSTFSYKVDGKTLHINASITLAAPSAPLFEMDFPSGIVIKDKVHPIIRANDTHSGGTVCLVKFLPADTNNLSRMEFDRTHTNTQQETLSFTATIELA